VSSDGTLPVHFFTKFLQEQNIKLVGAEDIKILRTSKQEKGPPVSRLRQLITDLEKGDAAFELKSDSE